MSQNLSSPPAINNQGVFTNNTITVSGFTTITGTWIQPNPLITYPATTTTAGSITTVFGGTPIVDGPFKNFQRINSKEEYFSELRAWIRCAISDLKWVRGKTVLDDLTVNALKQTFGTYVHRDIVLTKVLSLYRNLLIEGKSIIQDLQFFDEIPDLRQLSITTDLIFSMRVQKDAIYDNYIFSMPNTSTMSGVMWNQNILGPGMAMVSC